MNARRLSDGVLWVLLAIGFLGVAKVSLASINGNPCPHVGLIPVCHVVLVAYTSMILSLLIKHNGCKHHFFAAGWSVAFGIALLASAAEVFAGGGVCPVSGGGSLRGAAQASVPLCFVSLAILVVILVLFLKGPYQRACDAQNQSL